MAKKGLDKYSILGTAALYLITCVFNLFLLGSHNPLGSPDSKANKYLIEVKADTEIAKLARQYKCVLDERKKQDIGHAEEFPMVNSTVGINQKDLSPLGIQQSIVILRASNSPLYLLQGAFRI